LDKKAVLIIRGEKIILPQGGEIIFIILLKKKKNTVWWVLSLAKKNK